MKQNALTNVTNEKRLFMRVRCHIPAEFQLISKGDVWYPADVLDLSIIGVRLRFDPIQRDGELTDGDVEWQDVRFRFSDEPEAKDLVIQGHLLMIYERVDGLFTTGVEFTDVSPEQQFQLVLLYAKYRQAERA